MGRIRVTFDQSKLKFPVLLSKVEHKAWGTYSYFMESEGWFTIPQIRQAYDYGVTLTLYEVRYVLATEYEPFTEYMQYFIKLKNDADNAKKVLKTQEKTPENEKKLAEAEYNRTDSKLCMNSVLGKINSHIDRKQMVITRDENDAIAFMANTRAYRGTRIEEFILGGKSLLRCEFTEGGYHDHIEKFNSAPHLSGTMLGYSKMLMAAAFQYIAEIGGELVYTDTDSIIVVFTPDQRRLFAAKFVPPTKTLGGFDDEGKDKILNDFISVGTKKYIVGESNGNYEWTANGILARENTQRDIRAEFREVLRGDGSGEKKIIKMDHFDIRATHDFQLIHGNTAKNLRFICMKGKVLDDKGEAIDDFIKIPHSIAFWKDHAEFAAHAAKMKPIGWVDKLDKSSRTTPAIKINPLEIASLVNLPTRRQLFTPSRPATKPKKARRLINKLIDDMAGCSEDDTSSEDEGDDDADMEDQDFIDNDEQAPSDFSHTAMDFEREVENDEPYCVYVLSNDNHQSYIGSTNDLKNRLREHAGELKGGADITTRAVLNGHPFHLARRCVAWPSFTRMEAVKLETWSDRHRAGMSTADAIELVYGRARFMFPARQVKMI